MICPSQRGIYYLRSQISDALSAPQNHHISEGDWTWGAIRLIAFPARFLSSLCLNISLKEMLANLRSHLLHGQGFRLLDAEHNMSPFSFSTLAQFFLRIKIFFFLYLIYLAAPGFSCGLWGLVPRPGIKPRPPALEAWSLSHRTTREVRWPEL